MANFTGYRSEMGDKKPDVQIPDADMSHDGNHWYLKTPLTLSGRGVRLMRVLTIGDLCPIVQYKAGWNEYCVTQAAFERICNQYTVAVDMLL